MPEPSPYVLSPRSRRLSIRDIRHDDLVALSQTANFPTLLAVRVSLSAMYVDWAGTDEPFDRVKARDTDETTVHRIREVTKAAVEKDVAFLCEEQKNDPNRSVIKRLLGPERR